MKKLLVFLIFSFVLTSGYAQTTDRKSLDSLLQLSKTSSATTDQIDVLNSIAIIYSRMPHKQSKDSCLSISLLASKQSRKIDYKKGLADALHSIGLYYVGFSNSPAEATPYFLESLDLYKKLKNEAGVAKCYMQMGLINYIMQHYDGAIKNLQLSLAKNDISTTNYLLALSYTELDSFALAKKYFSISIDNYTQSKSQERLDECYLWLGRLYLKTGGLDTAFFYINRSIKNYTLRNDPLALVRPYAFIAEAYLESNNPKQAINYAEKSYKIESGKTTQQKDDLSLAQATKVLSKAYALINNYKKAYFYLDLYNTTNNRFTEGSQKQKVADMQSMFEFDQEMTLQKVRAEQQINEERILRNAFFVGSALLLLILIILYSRYNLKNRANAALRDLNEEISLEKQRSDDLLHNILPADIAKELKQTGKAEARDFENVSILFTDIKEFTQTSEKLSAKELVAEISACFEAFDMICEKYKVEKIKTIGDAYMAASGLSAYSEDSTLNTVLAALEMQQFITNRKNKKDLEGAIAFEMRAGIHTGNVVAGIVGVKKFQYDIWGDVVNTAARVESNGEVGKVNISQTTYELIKDQKGFHFEHRGKIEAKGKGEIEMWFVQLKKH